MEKMRKTPEEIEKGLECAENACCPGKSCVYYASHIPCIVQVQKDALALIRQLEADKKILEIQKEVAFKLTERVEQERDAAISELPHNCWNCKYHLNKPIEETDDHGRTIHRYCDADFCFPEEDSSWEWRGPCEENKEITK